MNTRSSVTKSFASLSPAIAGAPSSDVQPARDMRWMWLGGVAAFGLAVGAVTMTTAMNEAPAYVEVTQTPSPVPVPSAAPPLEDDAEDDAKADENAFATPDDTTTDIAAPSETSADYMSRGAAFEAKGQMMLALRAYEQATDLAPNDPSALVAMGRAYLALDKPEAAYVRAQMALTQNKNHPNAHYLAGRALEDLGRASEAIVAYRLSLARGPNTQTMDALDRVAALETAPY